MKRNSCVSPLLLLHHLVLAVDALDVDSVEQGVEELLAQAQCRAEGECSLHNILPTSLLQDADIVVALDETDILGHVHTLGKELKNLAIEAIYLLAQAQQGGLVRLRVRLSGTPLQGLDEGIEGVRCELLLCPPSST